MKQVPKPKSIAYQGVPGAYSHKACLEMGDDIDAIGCNTFEGAIAAVVDHKADLAMLPIENSTYGRVADIHRLLPDSGLHIVGEHFLRVNINLLGVPGAKLSDVRSACSHTVLLGQCRDFLIEHGITPVPAADTAGSAEHVVAENNPEIGALASDLAAEIYGLDILVRNVEDRTHNTTRFLLMARQSVRSEPDDDTVLTTFVFTVRNIPAALYKALGGFATNGVNMVKLESYMIDGSFTATQFYADVVGHPDEPHLARALEELKFFTSHMRVLGVYPMELRR